MSRLKSSKYIAMNYGNNKKRNKAIDFLKFVFAFIIVMCHGTYKILWDTQYSLFLSGYLGVEFFFIVSGYYMAKSAENKIPTQRFIINKYCKLMPNVYVSWMIAFVLYHIFSQPHNLKSLLMDFIQSIPELCLIYMSGIKWNGYLGILWYISVMLLAMMIIYPILVRFGDAFAEVIAPTVFVFVLGWLFQHYNHLCLTGSKWTGMCFAGFLRGVMELCGGVLCYKVSKHLRKYHYSSWGMALFGIIEWGLYIATIFYMFYHPKSKYDYIILLMMLVAVTITISDISFDRYIFKDKICCWLGEYSFSLYLGHTYFRNLHVYLFPLDWHPYVRMLAYVVLAGVNSLFIMYFSKYIRKIWKNKLPIIKRILIVK